MTGPVAAGTRTPARPAATATPPPAPRAAQPPAAAVQQYVPVLLWLLSVLAAVVVLRGPLSAALHSPPAQTWATLCVAVCVQALPFLALGIAVSTAIAALVPGDALARLLPASPARAVPLAGLAGALLPGCECGSVPVASG